MLLNDPKLAFAQDLIEHWSAIRGGVLVPFKEHIDPAAMRRVLPFIGMLDIARPEAPIVRLAGTGLRQRYGQEITGTDWSKYIMPENKPRMRAILGLLSSLPCGLYYHFEASADGDIMREAETVVLPLREQESGAPTLLIALTRDIASRGIADLGINAARLNALSAEFIDIGAGIPGGNAIDAGRGG